MTTGGKALAQALSLPGNPQANHLCQTDRGLNPSSLLFPSHETLHKRLHLSEPKFLHL